MRVSSDKRDIEQYEDFKKKLQNAGSVFNP